MSAVVGRALSASLAGAAAWVIVSGKSGSLLDQQGCFKGNVLRADSLGAGKQKRTQWAMEDQGLECGPRLVAKQLSS